MRELVAEAPTSIRYLMRLGAAFDPGADGAGPALTREGGHSRNRIVHAGGDRSGAEVQRTLDESAVAAGVERPRAGVRARPRHRHRRRGGRQAAGVTVATLDPDGRRRVGRRRDRARRRPGDGRLRPDLRLDVEPARRHRRRVGDRPAGRARGARRRVRAVPPDRDVARPGRDRAAAARQRGRPRRGRDPVRRGRRARHGRRPPARGPRATRRRRGGDQPAHGRGAGRRRRPRVPRRDEHRRALLRALPVDHRGVPRDRHRSGARPHPGRPGRPLRVRRRAGPPRRHDGAARPVRRRRGRVHRCARRQPAGVQQPHRGRRRRHPARARPRLGGARPGRPR